MHRTVAMRAILSRLVTAASYIRIQRAERGYWGGITPTSPLNARGAGHWHATLDSPAPALMARLVQLTVLPRSFLVIRMA